jgi:hypothetical protein
MDMDLVPGAFVTHPDHPEWGTGQIQSVIGTRVTVNFEQQGKLLVDLRHARLVTVARPRAPG